MDESKGNHARLQSGTHDGKSLRSDSSRSSAWIRPGQCISHIHDKRMKKTIRHAVEEINAAKEIKLEVQVL